MMKGGGKGKPGMKGGMRPPARPVQQRQAPPPRQTYVEPVEAAPSAPSFIGGAARKRRLELMGARGLLAPGMYCPNDASAPAAPVAAGRSAAAAPAIKRAAPAPAARAAPAAAKSSVKWIQVGEDCALVAEKGLPELAPAVMYEESIKDILSQATNILWEVAGVDSLTDFMVLEHDHDLSLYPDIAETVKASGAMGSEEVPMCIAICESQAKWAIGMAGNWKKREQATRLSLAVSLAANLEDFTKVARSYPDFARLCEAIGISTDGALGAVAAEPEPAPSKKQRKQAAAAAAPEPAAAAQDTGRLPREAPIWIAVEGELPEALAAYSGETLAVCTDGVKRPGLYNAAEKALAKLVEDPEGVEYLEDGDHNWERFGSVGETLAKIAPVDEYLCIAVCPEKECWAVGVSTKAKGRWSAARLALVCSLAIRAANEGEPVDIGESTSVAEFLEEAKAALENL